MRALFRLVAAWLLVLALGVVAHAQTSSIYVYVESPPIGADSPGVTIQVYAYGGTPTAFCFYTGYGSTTPIVPTPFSTYVYSVAVPASTIQSIPKASITPGTFTARVYAVSSTTTACTGTAVASYSQTSTASILPPSATTTRIRTLPQRNTQVAGTYAPTEIYLDGSGFSSAQTATLSGSFTSFTTPVTFISSSQVRIDAPVVPAGATTLNLTLCNTGPNNYCSAAVGYSVNSLFQLPGSLSYTQNSTYNYSLEADFGNSGSPAGVPLGTVSFNDGGTPLGTAAPSVTALTLTPGGTTATGAWTSSGGGTVQSVVADFDKDGLPDVLVYDSSTPSYFHLLYGGDNRGSLNNAIDISQGSSAGCSTLLGFAVADFNNDGYPDFAALCSSYGSSALFTFINQGDGTFSTNSLYGLSGTSIAAADMNKDGNVDLVLAGSQGDNQNAITVLFGDGTGNFPTSKRSFATNASGQQLLAVDLNNDGYPDVAVLNTTLNSYAIFQNDKTGGFSSTPAYLGTGQGRLGQIFVQRTAGSNFPNLLVSQLSPGAVLSLKNNQSATLGFTTGSGFAAAGLLSAAVGDFNGDGNQDVAYFNGSNITVFSSDSSGNFTSSTAAGTSTPLSPLPVSASNVVLAGSADVNTDGYADLYLTGNASTASNAFAKVYVTSGSVAAKLLNQTFSAGTHPLTATSPGTVTYAPDTASANLTIVSPVTASLTVSPAASPTYSPTTSEVLTAEYDSTMPITSLVTFMDGSKMLGQAQMMQNGANRYLATLGVQLTAGSHTLSFVSSTDSTLPGASTTYTVLKGQPVLTWSPNPSTIAYGTQLSSAQLDAVAQVGGTTIPGVYTYTPAAGATPGPGQQTLSVSFVPTDTVDYNSPVTATTSILVTYTPTLRWPAPAGIVYGTPLSATQLNATAVDQNGAAISGTFAYTPAAGTILGAGTQPLSVVFTPTDGTTYTTATASNRIVVSKATPVIAWATPASIPVGTALSATQLNASASAPGGTNVTGTFTYTPSAGTVLPVGSTQLNVSFVPTDAVDYNGASGSVIQVVTQASSAISAGGTPNPSTFGQVVTLSATVVTAPGATAPGGSVSFIEGSSTLGMAPMIAGTASLPLATLAAGRHVILATYSGDANYSMLMAPTFTQVVNQAGTTVVWQTPASIVYGTALGSAQLNATAVNSAGALVPGTFTYTPAAGTVLTAGAQTLQVAFQPADAVDYAASAGRATLQVTQATPAIVWATPAPVIAGTTLSSTQLNATATGIGGVALSGTFTYTPPAGTVVLQGTRTLMVSFVPADAVDYKTAGGSVQLTVNASATTVQLTGAPNPSTYGQLVTFVATVTPANTSTPLTGSVNFLDGSTTVIGTGTLTSGVASFATSTLASGTHNITAMYLGDSNTTASTSAGVLQVVNQVTSLVSWTPPAPILYGTLLSSTQLNATASTSSGATVPGTFVYTPGPGTLLPAGAQTLSVTFTPTDSTNSTSVTTSVPITVGKATPQVHWATPADVIAGTVLSSTQLNATATGVAGALAGTFTYTPPAGTVVGSGTTALSVSFVPTDLANYTSPVVAGVTLNGTAVTLTGLSTTTATLGDPAKTITLTGTGFVSNSVVSADGVPVPTTFVNGTTLTAVLPANDFITVHSISVLVNDPTQGQTTKAITISVAPGALSGSISGPPVTTVGAQPAVSFTLAAPYPVPVTATFQLAFAPASGLPNDPTVLFSNGTTTYTTVIPAGSTTIPSLQLQSGSVAGTITVMSTFIAGGVPIVSTGGSQTLTISEPAAVPGVAAITLARDPSTLTVTINGYSNTREIASVHFHFIASPGQSLDTTDLTIEGATLFTPYYASTLSQAYGSTFTYTQPFDLHGSAIAVGQVQVTLVNSVGNSTTFTVQ